MRVPKGLADAKETLTELKLSEPEKQEYQKYLNDLHYQASMVETNYHSGRLDGEKIGAEKGKREEKFEIAKNMKAAGMAMELIQQMTGLSEEEIQQLKS